MTRVIEQDGEAQLGASQPDVSQFQQRSQSLTGARRPVLTRATTDFGPRNASPAPADLQNDDDQSEMRHGWGGQFNSEEYLSALVPVSLSSSGALHDADSLVILHVFYRQTS